jgi:hypothetical protein
MIQFQRRSKTMAQKPHSQKPQHSHQKPQTQKPAPPAAEPDGNVDEKQPDAAVDQANGSTQEAPNPNPAAAQEQDPED